ncbi:mevalonate kinase [Proteiniborus sp. DW1]|uniref:mevalonate kinase n=1 Tax=Proteiniborus sp. DW1 TaxID=1889883 RepID=UPI00092E0361|nr:mevalonate kinase [Proteiniborus sp. DW1]SCG82802.1 mevalonate kinase [Proteiniborus sp. DW1]
MDKKTSVGTAIGKIILMGEHAVVYGEPAIAIPFPGAKVKTTIYKGNGPVLLDCLYYKGVLSNAPETLLGLTKVIKNITESLGEELKDFSINIESTILPERGMGSSAAVAIATIRALYDFFNRPLTYDELLKWTDVSEKIVHGNPSGIDAAIVSGEKTLYYIKGKPVIPFEFKLDTYLIVGDTGKKGQTRAAVEGVRQFIESKAEEGRVLIKELGVLTMSAKSSIESNDAIKLGESMTRAHNILDKLGVSDDNLNFLVSEALNSGALGAKLTGGGRGGCMIALASSREEANYISSKLLSSGAENTWISNLGVDLVDK